MELNDFYQKTNREWVSKEKCLFKNDKIEFNYIWVIDIHEYQAGWMSDLNNTRYNVRIVIDKDCIHENHKKDCSSFDDYIYCFEIKSTEKQKTRFQTKDLERIIKTLDDAKIEKVIKKNKYGKIKAILNGEEIYV